MDSECDRRARDEKRTIGCHRRSAQSEVSSGTASGQLCGGPTITAEPTQQTSKDRLRWLSFAEKEFEPEGFAGSRDPVVHRRVTKKHCFCSGRTAFCVNRKIFIYAKWTQQLMPNNSQSDNFLILGISFLASTKRQPESTSSGRAGFLATVFCVGCFCAFL